MTKATPRARKVKAVERLTGCWLRRDGALKQMTRGSHSELREYAPARPTDETGFVTSEGRYLDRDEAQVVGHAAGQCSRMGRDLLSSDIDWDGPHAPLPPKRRKAS